jgi:hypothetical protein
MSFSALQRVATNGMLQLSTYNAWAGRLFVPTSNTHSPYKNTDCYLPIHGNFHTAKPYIGEGGFSTTSLPSPYQMSSINPETPCCFRAARQPKFLTRRRDLVSSAFSADLPAGELVVFEVRAFCCRDVSLTPQGHYGMLTHLIFVPSRCSLSSFRLGLKV